MSCLQDYGQQQEESNMKYLKAIWEFVSYVFVPQLLVVINGRRVKFIYTSRLGRP